MGEKRRLMWQVDSATLQNCSRNTWKVWNGMSCSTCYIRQISICYGQFFSGAIHFAWKYEICAKNTRTGVIKNVLHLEVTRLGSLQNTLPPTHTLIPTVFPLLETVPVRFFCDGFQPLRRICLNLRNRVKSSSFEGFFKFWDQESYKEQGQVSGGEGGEEQWSSVWLKTHEFWVLSGLEHCRDGKTSCHFSTVLTFCVGWCPSDVSVLQCSKSGWLWSLEEGTRGEQHF